MADIPIEKYIEILNVINILKEKGIITEKELADKRKEWIFDFKIENFGLVEPNPINRGKGILINI